MNINATLIIQIINFYIAYVIIKYLMLRPAVRVIETYKNEINGLTKQINSNILQLDNRMKDKNQAWNTAQQLFIQRYPDASQSELFFFRSLTPNLTIKDIDATILQSLERDLTQVIIKKVGNDKA